jgi:hypothetical protein
MSEKDKLENITGSGIPITIKGKEYMLGIFGMRDLADFRQYIKGQRIKIIQNAIQYDSQEGRKKEIEIIQEGTPGNSTEAKAERLRLVTNIINDYRTERMQMIGEILGSNIDEIKELRTMDGVCFMLWKSLQKYQPDITSKDVDELIDYNLERCR